MTIRDAVSLVFTINQKVFIIKRQNYLRSFPGYTAFPGGKIDTSDFDVIVPSDSCHLAANFYGAIIREAQEELGIDLATDPRVLSINSLAMAVTPEFNPTRFHTYFFRIEVSEEIDFILDEGEFAEGEWLDPQVVLAQWRQGQRLCVPPVRQVLEELVQDFNTASISFPERYDSASEVPHVESICGLWQVMPLSDTVPPADRTNAFIFGDELKVLVDPAPRDEGELGKFLKTISVCKIDLVFLTHHHGDHHRNLPALIHELKVPVALSQDTYHRIVASRGADYFAGVEIKIVKHLEHLTTWLGKKVLCHHIPGHDEGHMGLAPETLEWFIAGDLFQGIGTVVIGGAEGDMGKYFNTLKYVIDLSPQCVIPSHGVPLGGTYILEKTLQHRKAREVQILEMAQQNLTVDQMLERIYFNIPAKLLKYARANIESHLKKLKSEGQIPSR